MSLWKNTRVIVLMVFLVLSIAAINPRPWQDGATIRSVDRDSAADDALLAPSSSTTSPVLRERIIAVNGEAVRSEADFNRLTADLPVNTTLRVTTNKQDYVISIAPLLNITVLPQLETITESKELYNATSGEFENVTTRETRNKTITTVLGPQPLGITVYDAPTTNIRLGLDLSGGARVLLEPEEKIDAQTRDIVIETIKQRLNVFGLSDIVVRPVTDLDGNQFILVEIAGATERDVRELVLKQGKFEAKIGDEVVLRGGTDITYVCRSPDCSGISQRGCFAAAEGYACEFQFSMTMTPDAAAKQANTTGKLAVVTDASGQQYLEKNLDLFLDDQLVDSLRIGASLKGSPVTQIAISGSGSGATQKLASDDTLYQMKQLQTVLITGSLPVKLRVVKTDAISSELGAEFINNSLFVGLLAFLAVTLTMAVRYRNPRISIPVIITLLGEVTIILGVAAVLGWNMDLAAIAGILIAIGTGVDDQIVMADEVLGGSRERASRDWKEKLKKAFFVIFTSKAVAAASLVPLLFAGAGLVKGFALTSLVGIIVGVFITRPAFAVILERLETRHDEKKH